ncbi:hypothetical protein BC828DRAFT_392437 [Blastocladiella britannica]|nr:hypothetical protein BC828DRAFT_392437 [Blastocladiella britannica]
MMSSGSLSRANSTPSTSHHGSSASLAAGGAASTGGAAASASADPRRRNKQKDDAIRRKVDQELARKSTTSTTRRSGPSSSSAADRSRSSHHGGASSNSNHASAAAPALFPHAKAGTVAALRPSAPVTIRQSVKVLDAAQQMAARRCDALLVVDQQDRLCGIVTDKDLAFRVVSEGLDFNTTKVFEVMTKNVQFVNANSTATEALDTMIAGGFRHLPVMDDEGDVVGVLDITKCLYDALERIDGIYGSSKKLTDALEDVQRDWASSGINAALSQQFELIRQKMLCPDLASILGTDAMMPPELSLKATVKDAARAMKQFRSTAALVFDESHRLAGIFTSKDIVLRVMAVKADTNVTSIIRVMTPHPDTVSNASTIYDALKQMHDHKYLHLPVVDAESGDVVGLVDVLKLTYNVLDKINSARADATDAGAWNDFWTSTFAPEGSGMHADSESYVSHNTVPEMYAAAAAAAAGAPLPPSALPQRMGTPQQHGSIPRHLMGSPSPMSAIGGGSNSGPSLIRPSDSASVVSQSVLDGPNGNGSNHGAAPGFDLDQCFTFKFRDPVTLAVHRVTSPLNLAFLVSLLKEKIGAHVEINTLSYADDDGDDIAVQSDADLTSAVAMARDTGIKRIVLKINGVAGQVEPALFPRRRDGSGAAGAPSAMDDSATDLYGRRAGYPPAPPSTVSMSEAAGPATPSYQMVPGAGATNGSRQLTPVPESNNNGSSGPLAPTSSGSGSDWLDRIVGAEHALEHPVVLVGMGALVTLSIVGLVSLVRK